LSLSLKRICFLLLAVQLVPAMPAASAAAEGGDSALNRELQGVSDRKILYADARAPQWKDVWDRARKLVREEKYEEAMIQYELLLGSKANLNEARWEYVAVLTHLEQWQRAAKELTVLLDHEPGKRKYLLARARVALAAGDSKTAARLFQGLYVSDTGAPDAREILEGLIAALDGLDHDQKTLDLLEVLLQYAPENAKLRRKTAELAYELGRYRRAGELLQELFDGGVADSFLLRLLARTREHLGEQEAAAVLWQRLVGRQPDDGEAHEHLAGYYHQLGNSAMELRHVENLVRIHPDNPGLLIRAARLNLEQGHADRALEYYNWLLILDPENRVARKGKKQAELTVASNLLALVENSGGTMLWDDLIKVTTDRSGIYRAMADMLRRKGRKKELADVLIMLHQENPEDTLVSRELIPLLEDLGGHDKLLTTLRSTMDKQPVSSSSP